MARNSLAVAAGGAALALAAVAFLTYRSSAEAIHQAKLEAAALRAQRDSIRAVASLRDSLRTVLTLTADSMRQRTDSLRVRVAQIEAGRQAAERAVWHLRDADATDRAFRAAFPEFANAVHLIDYQPDSTVPALRYVALPFNTERTFMVYRLRADSLSLVRDSLLRLDDLNRQVIALKDSVIVLGRLNEAAFQVGFDSAFAKYQRLNRDYQGLLRRPRLGINLPTAGVVIGSAVLGFVGGVVVAN